jgi:nucleotide-binding universal stress UspA family protein
MTSFSNILIPVDTFYNSHLAVQKAIDLCDEKGTTLHLVTRIRRVSLFTILYCRLTGHQTEELRNKKKAARQELRELKSKLNQEEKNIRFVSVIILKNNFKIFLKRYFLSHRIDLVVSSKTSGFTETSAFSKPFFFLVPKQTGIPVLTVLGENLQPSSRSILIPITGSIRERKVREALSIARKYNSQIHIITILDDSKPNVKQYIDSFYLAYKLFSDFGHAPQYKIMTGKHKEEILLRYAQRHNISMIFINADKLHQPVTSTGSKILRMLQSSKKIHVLPSIERIKSNA